MTDDRRAEPRTPVDVEVRVMTPLSAPIAGRVLDISPSGLRIRFHRPLPEGTRLSLVLGDEWISAIVRYCASVENQFDVGVLIEYAVRPERVSA
jgi:PilZ domain